VAADTIEISEQARELARAQQAVESAADVRSERVAQIKQRVEDGTYSVPIELLAQRLMDGWSDDR
jgi:negative regulator of flagellin synthesis FlgM